MKINISRWVVIFIALAALASPSSTPHAGPDLDFQIFLPFVKQAVSTLPGAIVVDHRHTDISRIPAPWIAAAKQFTVHYAHTSHGSQILDGLNWLEGRSSGYSVNIEDSGSVVHPAQSGTLNVYDGNNYPGDTYIVPEMFWASGDGLSHTRSVVNTGWFNVSLWTWCGQLSSYDSDQVQGYLDTLAQLQSQYPGVHFVYYTGHLDGSAPGSTLWQNNDQIRQYTQQHGGILFDFADIESYDPDGNFHATGSDACEWCADWCSAHPGHFACQSVPSGCQHTNGLQCTLKGQAFWYLLARLAGWNGVSQ